MNPLLERQSPFFESMNSAIDRVVPLAMEKYKLDQQQENWKAQLAETARAHDMANAGTFLKEYMTTGDPKLLSAFDNLAGKHMPGLDLSGLKPPAATTIANQKAEALQKFKERIAAGTDNLAGFSTANWTPAQLAYGRRQFEPEEHLKMYMEAFPEDIANITRMRHEIEADKTNEDYKKAMIRYYTEMAGPAALIRADKVGAGGADKPTALMKNDEYITKNYGPEAAAKYLLRSKDKGSGTIWGNAYTSALSMGFDADKSAAIADNAYGSYETRFPVKQKGGGGGGGGRKESWKDYNK